MGSSHIHGIASAAVEWTGEGGTTSLAIATGATKKSDWISGHGASTNLALFIAAAGTAPTYTVTIETSIDGSQAVGAAGATPSTGLTPLSAIATTTQQHAALTFGVCRYFRIVVANSSANTNTFTATVQYQ